MQTPMATATSPQVLSAFSGMSAIWAASRFI